MYNIQIIENTKKARDRYGHMWGSDTFELSEEQIIALLDGKMIAGDNGEYTTFICLGKEKE